MSAVTLSPKYVAQHIISCYQKDLANKWLTHHQETSSFSVLARLLQLVYYMQAQNHANDVFKTASWYLTGSTYYFYSAIMIFTVKRAQSIPPNRIRLNKPHAIQNQQKKPNSKNREQGAHPATHEGYEVIRLTDRETGDLICPRVHWLVALTFKGQVRKNQSDVADHADPNRQFNRFDNLS